MAYNNFNDEQTLIDHMRRTPPEYIQLLPDNNATRKILKTFQNRAIWVANMKNTNEPPDFYTEKHKVMGDIMQVDDCGHTVYYPKKSKYKNPQRTTDGQKYKELQASGILDSCPNLKQIFINSDTSHLSTNEHHQFTWYRDEFKRIIREHIDSLPLYHQKCPGYKTIFFIYDESHPYIRMPSCVYSPEALKQQGIEVNHEALHKPFLDDDLLQVLQETIIHNGESYGIDYVIWFFTNKAIDVMHKFTGAQHTVLLQPQLVVLDCSQIKHLNSIRYPINCMYTLRE